MTQPRDRRHIILIGLSGSGKSTVAPLVAALLGTHIRDLDGDIEHQAGMSVRDIFSTKGEAAFRTLERAVMRSALGQQPHVIAAGGGWAQQPGALEEASLRALVVYLRVRPEVAASRLETDGSRPLIDSGDPAASLRHLLDERDPRYAGAEHCIETSDRTADEVAAEVVRLARRAGGW